MFNLQFLIFSHTRGSMVSKFCWFVQHWKDWNVSTAIGNTNVPLGMNGNNFDSLTWAETIGWNFKRRSQCFALWLDPKSRPNPKQVIIYKLIYFLNPVFCKLPEISICRRYSYQKLLKHLSVQSMFTMSSEAAERTVSEQTAFIRLKNINIRRT